MNSPMFLPGATEMRCKMLSLSLIEHVPTLGCMLLAWLQSAAALASNVMLILTSAPRKEAECQLLPHDQTLQRLRSQMSASIIHIYFASSAMPQFW